MSRNDCVYIYRTSEGIYEGFDISGVLSGKPDRNPDFEALSMKEAIIKAQKIPSEYGYRFMNLTKELQIMDFIINVNDEILGDEVFDQLLPELQFWENEGMGSKRFLFAIPISQVKDLIFD